METKTKQNTSPGGGSAHRDQSTGNFTVDTMIQCINEIKQVKAEAAAKGETPKLSRNMIQAKQYLCLLLPRRGALFVEFVDIYCSGAPLYGLLALCLHLCLLILLPFCPLHLIYPLKQGRNLLDLFSSETGATIYYKDCRDLPYLHFVLSDCQWGHPSHHVFLCIPLCVS